MKFLLSSSLLVVASTASAGPRIELGIATGGHAFSHSTELGVPDDINEPGPNSSGMIGTRIAVPFTSRLAVEGELMYIPTKDDVLGDFVSVFGLRTHLRFDILTGRVKPFLVVGAGMHILRSSSPQMSNDVDQAYHWGGGVRFAINDKFEVRLDARELIVPDRTINGATSDFEVTAGMTYRLGSAPKPLPPAPPPPVEQEPAPPPPAPPPPPPPPGKVITELTGIGFELDSAKIDVMSADLLEKAYQLLVDFPTVSVEVSGHTSSEGNGERNLQLSLQRAESVKAYLVKRGIEASRILTVGHGSDVPVADNKTEDGRSKNRRIEFKILQPTEVPQ
jgi:outer membrane protein OmpA-like peptidoglycan-associated protein